MKKIQIIPLAALLCICFCFAQCRKNKSPAPDNPYGLPNATQTGSGFLACRINGLNFIGVRKFPFAKGAVLNADTLYVDGEPGTGRYFEIISIAIKGNLQQGSIYNVDSITSLAFYSSDSSCNGISSQVVNSYSKTGAIQLTKFDTTDKIVSGTFNFDFPISDCDTLHVTEGRFDYHYY
ncbi:MAG: hypothetical protein ACTHOB_18395 [Ginsengibacter sp.]